MQNLTLKDEESKLAESQSLSVAVPTDQTMQSAVTISQYTEEYTSESVVITEETKTTTTGKKKKKAKAKA